MYIIHICNTHMYIYTYIHLHNYMYTVNGTMIICKKYVHSSFAQTSIHELSISLVKYLTFPRPAHGTMTHHPNGYGSAPGTPFVSILVKATLNKMVYLILGNSLQQYVREYILYFLFGAALVCGDINCHQLEARWASSAVLGCDASVT